MSKESQRPCRRIDRAERSAIERALDAKKSARSMAADLGRSPSSICDEVKRSRTATRGPNKGERVRGAPADACPKLVRWPYACNGCNKRRYNCSKRWKCEYSAARAQRLADELLREARKGVDRTKDEFEHMMDLTRFDVSRGLSPSQIAAARNGQLKVAPSTIYRWIERGYGGMGNLDLRRKCGYKKRNRKSLKQTSHGRERSFGAFTELSEDERAGACEMGAVIGRASDSKCALTLHLRPCKLQLAILLPQKTSSAVASALDMLEAATGKSAFKRMFGVILADNGVEFSDFESWGKSSLAGVKTRARVYYCDVRQSQQKGACEKNHVELRKLLPKRRGIRFDDLAEKDMAVVMAHLNSEPRGSLANLTPIEMLLAAYEKDGERLLEALGVAMVPCEDLRLDVMAINEAREKRGEDPLT